MSYTLFSVFCIRVEIVLGVFRNGNVHDILTDFQDGIHCYQNVTGEIILDGVKNIVFEGHAELFKTWIVVN